MKRIRTTLVRAVIACVCFLSVSPVLAQKAAPQKPAGETLTIDPAEMHVAQARPRV